MGADVIRLTAIVSGGQTGADRGGLDAAIELGLGYGGWAPQGWRAEDGEVPAIYRERMRQTESRDYGLRTRLNVQDSDATLLFSFADVLTGGSKFTADAAKQQRKPCKHLVLPARGKTCITDAVRAALLEWVRDKNISVLNVAGPRASKEPGLQEAVRDALVWIFEDEMSDGMTMEPWQALDAVEEALAVNARLEALKAKQHAENEALRREAWAANAPVRAAADAFTEALAENRAASGDFVVSREDFYRNGRIELPDGALWPESDT